MRGHFFTERCARILTFITLFLLPWQMRYIFWRPIVGITESEFGVISVYVTMLLALGAAASWRVGLSVHSSSLMEENSENHKPLTINYKLFFSRLLSAVCSLFSFTIFLLTYPSPAHAWILNICFAIFLGYATYQAAKQDVRSVVIVILFGFIPVFGLGIWQMIAGWSPASTLFGLASRSAAHLGDTIIIVHGYRILRMYGSFPHPNIFGTAIALVFGVLASLSSRPFLSSGQASEGPPPCVSSERFLQIVVLITSIFLVLFCISRSAALAMVCASIAAYAVSRQKKKILLLAFFLPVVVWSLQFISPGILALRGQSFTEQLSITERVDQMSTWWQVMRHDGLFGTGLYGYPQAVAQVQGASLPAWAYQPMHNVFLLIIAEVGVVGCCVFGAVMKFGSSEVRKWGRDEREKKMKNFGSLFSFFTFLFKFPSSLLHNFKTSELPFFITFFSLALFDHALWTSWSGMAYVAVATALVFAGGQSRISTLDQRVLDESK